MTPIASTPPDVPGVGDDALQRCADEPIAVPGAIQPHGALLAVTEPDLAVVNPLRVRIAGAEVDLVVHRADGLLVTEWEPLAGAEQAEAVWHARLALVLQRLAASGTLDELTASLARDVRALTGFDRVMVYRFDPEWNGEVVAEDCSADLEPFLGLRYPASDIPAQARALYATNWLRLIPDATYRRGALGAGAHPPTR